MFSAQQNTLPSLRQWFDVGMTVEQEQAGNTSLPFVRRATIFDGKQRVEPAVCRDLASSRIGLVHFAELQSDEVYVEVVTGNISYGLPCRIGWQKCHAGQLYISSGEVDKAAESLLTRLKRLSIWDTFARRFFRRRPLFAPVVVHSPALGNSWELRGVTTDASERGIGLLLREPLGTHERVDVTVLGLRGRTATARFEIKWCKSFGVGLYRCGGLYVPS